MESALRQARREGLLEIARARSGKEVLVALARAMQAGLEARSATAAQLDMSRVRLTASARHDAILLDAPSPLVHALRPILASRQGALEIMWAKEGSPPAVTGTARREGARPEEALLAAPIRAASGRLEGVLYAFRGTPFGSEDMEYAEDLARHGAIALHHARREAEARTAQDRLATFSTFSGDVMWDWDPTTGRIWWSENTGRELDDPPARLLGPPAERGALIHPEDWPGYERAYREALEGGSEEWAAEYRFRPREGVEIPVMERGWIMRDSSGRARRVFGAITNATERHEAERLRAERDAALRTERLQSEFLANMSHEIRTPIGVVIGMASLLEDTTLDPDQREYARGIRTSADHLLTVINDILDLSKLQAGHAALDHAPYEVRAVLRATVEILSPKAHEKGLELRIGIDPEVPPWVDGDAGRLRQVLVNIVGNAIKFTDEGHVRVRAEQAGADTIRFSVEDTGIGMDEDQMARLFRPFTQLHADAARRFGGTGLGLSISKRYIELMGGTIEVASAPEEGTTFTFTVRAPPVAPPVQPALAVPPLPPDLSILVVDDLSENRILVLRMLEKLGLRAQTANDGLEALDALAARPYDVILMDIQMPRLDGLETTRRIRSQSGPQPRIIAMTASALRGDHERCLAAGMDDHLAKPILIPALRNAIHRVLGGSSVQDPVAQEGAYDHLAQFAPSEREEILAILRREVPARVVEIRKALVARDVRALAAEAHRLRGAARLLGLAAVSDLCVRIERSERDGETALAIRCAESLLEALPAWLHEPAPTAPSVETRAAPEG